MNNKKDKSIILFNLSFFGGQMSQLLTLVTEHVTRETSAATIPLTIVTPNPEQVVMTRNKPEFLRVLQRAGIRIPDGIGLIYASKILHVRYGTPILTKRIAGKSVVQHLLSWLQTQSVAVLVIGGRDLGTSESITVTESQSLTLVPQLKRLKSIAVGNNIHLESERWYWLEGYQDVKQPTPTEERTIRHTIEQVKPAVVFVAFGAPDQELWLDSHRELLQINQVKLAMVVGGAFDVLTGYLKPAPAWIERSGFEWLFRLWQQPSRWSRQLKLLEFLTLVFAGFFNRETAGNAPAEAV